MATISEVRSEETKSTSWKSQRTMSYEKLSAKNIISDMPIFVTTDPIDSKRISKNPTNSLTKSSLIKAGLVFFGTVGTYYLAKTTNILSYFGWGVKNSNLKDFGNNEIVSAKKSLSARTNLETTKINNNPSINRIAQTYKGEDKTVKFEEIKVKEFKDLLEVEKEERVLERRSVDRRSISVQNPIPDQNVIVGKSFNLTIDGNSVFTSNTIFLKATNIPAWLTSRTPNPTVIGSYDTPGRAREVILSENYAYVADYYMGLSGLQIIDVTNPSNPTFVGSYNTPDLDLGVVISGNYAYMAYESLGLQIIDITDSVNPTFVGSYDMSGWANGVALSGNYAYVANAGSGLQIIDISDPENPTLKGLYNTPGWASGVAVSGNYAYVADDGSGLQIVDISNPSNPTFKSSCDVPRIAWKVALSGNYAYVVGGFMMGGLLIIDISDLSNPTLKGSYDTPGGLRVTLLGNYAYVTGDGNLQIIDISNSTNPTFKSSYNTPGYAYDVTFSGNYAYVADGSAGLLIITPNLDKLILSGTPNVTGTYGIDIKACNEISECITDSFDIIIVLTLL
jgi:hypothetical protein